MHACGALDQQTDEFHHHRLSHLQYRRLRATFVLVPYLFTVAFSGTEAGPKLAVLLQLGCRQRALRRSTSLGSRCKAHLQHCAIGFEQTNFHRCLKLSTRRLHRLHGHILCPVASKEAISLIPRLELIVAGNACAHLSRARLAFGPYDGVLVHRITDALSPSRATNVQWAPKTRVWLVAACAAQYI